MLVRAELDGLSMYRHPHDPPARSPFPASPVPSDPSMEAPQHHKAEIGKRSSQVSSEKLRGGEWVMGHRHDMHLLPKKPPLAPPPSPSPSPCCTSPPRQHPLPEDPTWGTGQVWRQTRQKSG